MSINLLSNNKAAKLFKKSFKDSLETVESLSKGEKITQKQIRFQLFKIMKQGDYREKVVDLLLQGINLKKELSENFDTSILNAYQKYYEKPGNQESFDDSLRNNYPLQELSKIHEIFKKKFEDEELKAVITSWALSSSNFRDELNIFDQIKGTTIAEDYKDSFLNFKTMIFDAKNGKFHNSKDFPQ